MKRLIVAALLGAILWTPSAIADVTPEQYAAIVEGAITKYLRPGFDRLQERTEDLAANTTRLCQAPAPEKLAELRTSFTQVLDAWSRVEYARLGPMIEEQRLERFSFWPDRKGIGLRQVQAVLAEKDRTAIDPDTLRDKSVAVQGLQALEFVLFGTGSESLASGDDFRCAYGKAIAGNLAMIASEVSKAWDAEAGYAWLMRQPGPDNPVYRSASEPAADIVEILTTGLQFIRDVKLGAFVGDDPESARPRLAAFWRSGQALAAIKANFEGLQELYEVSGLIAVLETRPNGPGLVESVDFEFEHASDTFAAGFPPVAEATADPEEHSRLRYLSIIAGSLWRFFAEDISGVLGLRIGFNALDGD